MATNRDLLKEAIADAKAVKHMAIENAKAALEEAFTPQINSLFSAKLREMEEEDIQEEVLNEEEITEVEDELEEEIDLNEMEDELSEDVIDEVEDEESEEGNNDEEESEMKIEDMTEEDLAKLIEDIMLEEFPELAQMRGDEEGEDEEELDIDGIEDEEGDVSDMDVDLAEMLREIEEEDMVSENEEIVDESTNVDEELRSELAEAYNVIDVLRSELTEINMLNAKLLYTNKIFKSKNLSESQKLKVLSSFDKTTTVKEVKLVYETLSEGLKVKVAPTNNNVGRASKSTISPTVKKPIIEANEAFTRMQKLAGLI